METGFERFAKMLRNQDKDTILDAAEFVKNIVEASDDEIEEIYATHRKDVETKPETAEVDAKIAMLMDSMDELKNKLG